MSVWRIIAGIAVAAGFSACGGEATDAGSPSTSGSVCERWAALSEARGCAVVAGCNQIECDPEYQAWLDCIETDLTGGCACEQTDGDLNCEGSWKPDEGTARCTGEYDAVRSCSQ